MILETLKINGLQWIHVLKPDSNDIEYIKNIHPFHKLVLESIENPTHHPLFEDFEDHFFFVLHFPVIYRGWEKNDIIEVDFLVTKESIVTVTYEDFNNLSEVINNLRKNEEIRDRVKTKNSAILLHHIISELFSKLLSHLDVVEEGLDNVETEIFQRSKKRMRVVENISNIRMDILDFWRTVQPQQQVLKSLPERVGKFYDQSAEPYFFDLLNTEERIRNIIENQKETIESLHQTNESLMSGNTNNIISLLTIFSTIILPLNLIASMWGMNHEFLPLRDGPMDFWIVVFGMMTIAVIMLVVFRKIRWL